MEEDKKFCPLLFASFDLPEEISVCLEKKCAWWDKLTGLCAVSVIARFGSEGSFYRERQEQKESIDKARGG